MSPPGRLPVAPRPLSGEALSSWVSRFAARYGLEPDRFMAALVPRVNWTEAGGTLRLLDRGPTPPGTDAALAAAAGLPRGAVTALRLHAPAGQPCHPWPRRSLLNLCRECTGDMVARCGEVHWRADWAFGGMVFCPEHRLELGFLVCGACGWNTHPRAVQGRLRLWCVNCSAWPDDRSDGQQHFNWAPRFKDVPNVLMSEAAWTLVSRLQSDLLRAACGQAPEWAWVSKTRSDNLLTVVRHLAFLLVGFPWSDRASPHWHPGYEHVTRMTGALAVVAAVLDGAASPQSYWPEREPVLLVAGGECGYDLSELYGRLSWADAGLLRRALPGCGPQRLLRVLEERVREVDLHKGPLEEQARLALARRKRDRSAWRPVRLSGTEPAVTLRENWA